MAYFIQKYQIIFPSLLHGHRKLKQINNVWKEIPQKYPNLCEQRFESVFVFPDEYRTILTWAAPLKIPGIFVRGHQSSHRDRNSNSFNRVNIHIIWLVWSWGFQKCIVYYTSDLKWGRYGKKTLKGQHTFDWWSNSPTQWTLSNCISNYSSGRKDSKNV